MQVTMAAAFAVSLFLAAAAAAQPANQLSPAEQKAGWTLLFNGTSLDGWRGYKKPDASGTRWVVKDGLLCLDRRADVGDRHREELVTCEAIGRNRGAIGCEEGQGLAIVDPHRGGAALEEKE